MAIVRNRQNNCKTLYMMVDLKNDEQTLFVGNIHEICKFAGTTPNSLHSWISHCKRKGKPCKYVVIGREDEDEYEL